MTLLSLADYKAIVGTTAGSDAAIDAALLSSEEVILAAIGPIGDQVEHCLGGLPDIMLGRRAKFIVAVFERDHRAVTELDRADYKLSASGGYVSRLLGGPHPAQRFRGQVEIRYEPFVGLNLAKTVQAELVALDVGDAIGAAAGQRTRERIGEWEEAFASTAVSLTPEQRREEILARLTPPKLTYWRSSGHSAVPGVAGS